MLDIVDDPENTAGGRGIGILMVNSLGFGGGGRLHVQITRVRC